MDGFSVVEQKLADSYDHFISTVFIWSYEISIFIILTNSLCIVFAKYYCCSLSKILLIDIIEIRRSK